MSHHNCKLFVFTQSVVFLRGPCEKYTDILVYVKNNAYFCKTIFRKQYNKEKWY